jgi:hypothetical protein
VLSMFQMITRISWATAVIALFLAAEDR